MDNLDSKERSLLMVLLNSEGFPVFEKIMVSEVNKFTTNLLNVDINDEKSIIANHFRAKAAAQFYAGILGRLNEEKLNYTSVVTDNPVDITKSLNMDSIEDLAAQLPDIF